MTSSVDKDFVSIDQDRDNSGACRCLSGLSRGRLSAACRDRGAINTLRGHIIRRWFSLRAASWQDAGFVLSLWGLAAPQCSLIGCGISPRRDTLTCCLCGQRHWPNLLLTASTKPRRPRLVCFSRQVRGSGAQRGPGVGDRRAHLRIGHCHAGARADWRADFSISQRDLGCIRTAAFTQLALHCPRKPHPQRSRHNRRYPAADMAAQLLRRFLPMCRASLTITAVFLLRSSGSHLSPRPAQPSTVCPDRHCLLARQNAGML